MSDYLCEDLIVEIFTRLPSKSLLRFTSLSKSLRSYIASSGFIHMHTSRSPQRLTITHQLKTENKYLHDFICTLHEVDQLPLCPERGYIGITPVKFPFGNLIVVGSCNGILCLLDYELCIITLLNPSIRRQLTLPHCPSICSHEEREGIGFGFDPLTDDIKIVSISKYGRIVKSPFVYAMKTGNWRPIASPMPLYSKVLSRACFVNGVLHWVVERDFTSSKDVELRYIMTFDLSTHVFGMIALPEHGWETELTTIQGSLAVIAIFSIDTWIWVRRDDSWSVVFKLKRNQVEEEVEKVLEHANNGDLLLHTWCKDIHVYNPKIEAQSRLVNFNDISLMIDMNMYVESLRLLDMGTACEVYQPSFLAGKKRKRSC